MVIQVKLFATLGRYRPGVPAASPFTLELPPGSTLADLIAILGLPSGEINLTFVNGRIERPDHPLRDRDEVGFFPLIGGG